MHGKRFSAISLGGRHHYPFKECNFCQSSKISDMVGTKKEIPGAKVMSHSIRLLRYQEERQGELYWNTIVKYFLAKPS